MNQETYEVFAIRYATRDALRSSHFIGGDSHEAPMPMDYFVWLVRHGRFSHGYEVEDVVGMVRLVFGDRVRFHAGSAELAPGISVHHIGGHTMGLQCVRVATARGWLVLASDCSHYYEHMETGRVFPTTFHVGDTIEGYDKLRSLAESPQHIIPGHDPLVMKRYPAPTNALEGIAVRLDVPPANA
jgi:glyoxylase-like metal-dependent hydrolase (beta-lactamase superfamily II)